jgi:hypothetical protein
MVKMAFLKDVKKEQPDSSQRSRPEERPRIQVVGVKRAREEVEEGQSLRKTRLEREVGSKTPKNALSTIGYRRYGQGRR